jgi:hypothetical protein
MPSAVATQKIRSELKVETWDHDPGATTAIVTSPDGGTTIRTVDMSVYRHFSACAMVTIPATGALTLLEIIAAEAATMASPEVIKTSGAIVADAVGDWAMEECSAEEIAAAGAAAGKALRFVAARLTMSNAGAEAVVTHIALPVYPRKDLTPATTIA